MIVSRDGFFFLSIFGRCQMEWLADLWEDIPWYVVVLVSIMILVGLYFGMRALHVPSWGIYLVIGGLLAGGLVAALRILGERFG
jgi:hypothetical protein